MIQKRNAFESKRKAHIQKRKETTCNMKDGIEAKQKKNNTHE